MTAQIIDGKAISTKLLTEIAADVDAMVKEGLPRPGLATVLVGENPASQQYVRMKRVRRMALSLMGMSFPKIQVRKRLKVWLKS